MSSEKHRMGRHAWCDVCDDVIYLEDEETEICSVCNNDDFMVHVSCAPDKYGRYFALTANEMKNECKERNIDWTDPCSRHYYRFNICLSCIDQHPNEEEKKQSDLRRQQAEDDEKLKEEVQQYILWCAGFASMEEATASYETNRATSDME